VSELPVRRSWPGPLDWTEPVTTRVPAVVVTTVGVLALLCWRIGLHPELAGFLYLGVVGVPLAFVDVALKRLPDLLTLPSYPVGLVLLGVAAPFAQQGGDRFVHGLIGLAALLFVFGAQWFVMPRQIGFGDVKLSGVLGLYLGWFGLSAWVFGLLAMFILGGVFSVGLLVTRRAGRSSTIPFGPFMLAGTLLAVLVHG
jgi:leader peptidase (prepilin peptidase) / N-methyltransferase